MDLTILTHATVIDGTGAAPRRDMTVVLGGGKILWLGNTALTPPMGGRVVDVRGKFVIPGLWDMHTHGADLETIFPPLYLANGVTGIREMWGYAENRAVRDKIESGKLAGPRMVMASGIIDGPVSLLGPPVTKVANEAEARQAVRTAKAEGSDFVKVYSYLGREALRAIADESHRQGLPFVGHLAYRSSLEEASDLGQRSFEHLFGLPISTSSRESEFRAIEAATPFDSAAPSDFFKLTRELERQATASYSRSKAAALFARFKRNGSWQSPTLTVNRVMSSPAGTYAQDPRLKYMPAEVREMWAAGVKTYNPVTPKEVVQQRDFLRARLELVGEMDAAGVGLISGTDALNPYVLPGFGLHDELALMVEAGLSPMRALQTATRDAARFLGLEDSMGTIAPGKVADLVVLDANPLTDIKNSQKVYAVVARGRLISSVQREKMLADVEAAASVPLAGGASAKRRVRAPCGCFAHA